jgi:hypothetical protein
VSVEPDEIEQTLIKTARLAEENNKILRRMQRAQRTAAFFRFVQWFLIVGSFVLLYYYWVQPFIAEIQATTETYKNVLDSGKDTVRYEALENFLDSFNISGESDAQTNTQNGEGVGSEEGANSLEEVAPETTE